MINSRHMWILEIILTALAYTLLPSLIMLMVSVSPVFLILGLFFPLPIYILTLKQGTIAGLWAVGLAFIFSLMGGVNLSLLIMGCPVLFLCHKALKSRPSYNKPMPIQGMAQISREENSENISTPEKSMNLKTTKNYKSMDRAHYHLEWYPLSLLIQWSTIFAIGIVVLTSSVLYLVISPQPQVFIDMFHNFNPHFKDKITLDSLTTLYTYVPGILAGYWVIIQFLNGYTAQRILEKSKKNIRPMPTIFNLNIHHYWYYALGFCLVMILISKGIFEYIFQNLALCIMIPFFFMGLSVFHHGLKMAVNPLKQFIFIFYVLFFLIPTLTLIIVALGIVEPWVELRKKFDARQKN